MLKRHWMRLSALGFLMAGLWVARTQNPPPAQPILVNKITDDLYMLEGPGIAGNVAVYLTSEGVILVDDKFAQNFDEIMADVKKLSPLPVKYVLSTHQHGDHTGGHAKMLAANAEIISQKNARDNMATLKMPGPARISFTDQASVFLGGKEVQMRYYGRGHTNGDAVVYFPALRILHTGDLFFTGPRAPNVDYSAGGSIVDWTGTLDGVLKLDFDKAIPGHGPVSDKDGLRKWQAHIDAVRTRVRTMAREGKSEEDVKKTLMSDFGWLADAAGMRQVPGIMKELQTR